MFYVVREIFLLESCDWSFGQYLQTSNEALAMSFTYSFQKFISSVNVLTFERKILKFYFKKYNFEINF